MKQALRLLRTLILLSLLVGSGFHIYSQKIIEPPKDNLLSLYNYYQTGTHDSLGEYQIDLDYLIWEKQAILDTLSYSETIQYYLSGTYTDTIEEIALKKLYMIDSVIEDIENKIKLINIPDYIKLEKKEVSLGIKTSGGKKLILRPGVQTEIAEYMLSLNDDKDMVATFLAESGLNPYSVGKLDERGMCQLMPLYNPIVHEQRFKDDWKYQAEKCVEKWLLVPVKGKIRMAYPERFKYLK